MNRATRGGFWTSVLVLIVLMTGCTGAGYAIGRYLIGEHYVKRGAVAIRTQPRPQPASRGFAPLPSASDAWRFEAPEYANEEWLPEDQGGPQVTIEEVPVDVSAGREGEATMEGDGEPAAGDSWPAAKGRYTIQVGVFLDERNSQALIDDLNNRGYPARVERIDDAHGSIYRVVTGDFDSQRSADRAAERLMNEGYTGAFVSPAAEGAGHSDESASGHSESR